MHTLPHRPPPESLSFVVPAHNEAAGIADFLQQLCAFATPLASRIEVVVVNDGSRDATGDIVASLCGTLPVKLVELSRNFGKEAALTAGLDHVTGAVTVLIDADFQHPFDAIPRFIEAWQNGYDMVYGVRESRADETRLKRFGARLFYALLNRLSSVEIPADAGDFRLLDARLVTALRSMPERGRFMKGLYAWVGFRAVAVPFSVRDRVRGASSFSLRALVRLAQTGIIAFSDVPLRAWSVIGVVISAIALAYASWIVFVTLAFGRDVPGWATITVAMMFFGGVQLLSIGILGEYLAAVFNEVKQRPTYLVARRIGFDQLDNKA